MMKSPSSASAISHKWVEFVLQHHEAKTNPAVNVQLDTFTVGLATKPGESFNAELIRVDASAKLVHKTTAGTAEAAPESKEYSLIAKFLSPDPFNREMTKKVGYHIREYTMYAHVIPALNKHWLEHCVNKEVDQRISVPDFVYGVCQPGEYVLVMENCKIKGYETNDKHKGLDFHHLMMAVQHIARLHALSYSYNLTNCITEKYPCFEFSKFIAGFFKPLVMAALENTIKFVKSLPNEKEILTKLEKGRHTIPMKFPIMFEDQTRHQLMCLTHGDFWNSNLLFQYVNTVHDGERRIEHLKLIDWQISQWGNPAFDLHYLFNTSTTAAVRKDHQDEILRKYHKTFTSITESLNTPVPDWNYDQFYAEFGRLSLVGFMMGMCLIQGTLSKAGEKLIPSAQNSLNSRNTPMKVVINKFKTAAAKVFIPLALIPSSQFIVCSAMKKILYPIGQELVDGKNTILNERLLGLLHEANESGLLDALSL